ncbi:hypothetical protein BH09PSE6_BH09PSE6_23560 [soil metagenome]
MGNATESTETAALPHERDQGKGTTPVPKPSADMKQAFDDVQSGQQDTDRRHATDKIEDKQINPDGQGSR